MATHWPCNGLTACDFHPKEHSKKDRVKHPSIVLPQQATFQNPWPRPSLSTAEFSATEALTVLSFISRSLREPVTDSRLSAWIFLRKCPSLLSSHDFLYLAKQLLAVGIELRDSHAGQQTFDVACSLSPNTGASCCTTSSPAGQLT